MKKFLIAGLALTAALSFTGCDLIIDILETAANGTSSQDITQTATESKTWNYSATNNIYEIGPEVASVTIKNYSAAKGKTIKGKMTNNIQGNIHKVYQLVYQQKLYKSEGEWHNILK